MPLPLLTLLIKLIIFLQTITHQLLCAHPHPSSWLLSPLIHHVTWNQTSHLLIYKQPVYSFFVYILFFIHPPWPFFFFFCTIYTYVSLWLITTLPCLLFWVRSPGKKYPQGECSVPEARGLITTSRLIKSGDMNVDRPVHLQFSPVHQAAAETPCTLGGENFPMGSRLLKGNKEGRKEGRKG